MLLTLAFGAWGQTSEQAFQDNDTLEMIQQKIERNGYGFTVGHNWVFDMTPEQKQAFFSRRPSALPRVYGNYDNIGPLADELGKTLPAAFDWRNVQRPLLYRPGAQPGRLRLLLLLRRLRRRRGRLQLRQWPVRLPPAPTFPSRSSSGA